MRFNSEGDPSGVERLGIALEPKAEYELRPDGGGCEDARVTFVEPLGHYVMTYTANSCVGPRIALAISKDLVRWERLGLVSFEPFEGIEFNGIDDKDASVFPSAVLNPDGQPSLAILHRPLFPGTSPEEKSKNRELIVRDLQRESIWISYRRLFIDQNQPSELAHFTSHDRLAAPEYQWGNLKIGGGTPPVQTSQGWLLLYHGVHEESANARGIHPLCYSAGVMLLANENPRDILYRSKEPVLTPELPEERSGTIGDVVFPTGIDRRDDIGLPNRFDVYYGMADDRIGVARLDLPADLAKIPQDSLPS